MNSTVADVSGTLSLQCRRQRELDGRRRTWWIPWLFLVGFGLSALGLAIGVTRFQAEGSPIGRVAFLALSTLFFGWTVVLWLMPLRLKPRIVPYFHRQIEEFGRSTSGAFTRG